MTDRSTTALIVVDVQNDFCPGGALGVAGGDRLGATIAAAAQEAGTLVATRDCHPAGHISFRDRGGPWPSHCVEGTTGAELHTSVAGLPFDIVQDKGRDPDREQYSDFDGTDLADQLRGRGVTRVLVAGLATDYCVRATALDAIEAGFDTTVLVDAVAAVDVEPGDGERALREIRAAGGRLDRVALLRGREQLQPMLDDKVSQLREVVERAGRSRATIGLSGGIDSALSLAIAARALGPENVTAITLPSRHTEQVHIDDARACAEAAGLPAGNFLIASIEPILEGIAAVRPSVHDQPLRFGNASARARMITIYDLAQEQSGLVIGTENRSEYYLGYFTRFGDAASDVEPIWDLYKTEVKLAAEMMGQPEAVLVKHPTAGLWGGQTDEQELGFTYRDADLAIVCLGELGMSVEQAAERSGVEPSVVKRVQERVAAVAWKHHVPHAL
jgi:nicotinamidase/pyrazinamidase